MRLPLLKLAVLAALCSSAAAHDIPNDITIQMFVKPAGKTLTVLVRAPLMAMRDIDFPKRGQGALDIARAEETLRYAAANRIARDLEFYENNERLLNPQVTRVRASMEGDRAFASYEDAIARMSAPPLPPETEIPWEQVMLDAAIEYPIASDTSDFSLRVGLDRLGMRVVSVIRFLPPTGVVRAFEFLDDPGVVRLDPSWLQAALRFVEFGFFHILEGIDHLLFLLCLVIPFRRFMALIPVVTSFTVAHSITLIASAYDLGPNALWFPPLIETLIAMSIVYMALENIIGGPGIARRWMITFLFGLVHGFGFSFALRETLQFAGSHLLASLVSFNIGVELGQILVLALVIPALQGLFKFAVPERIGTIILSALVAHTGWHWMIERGEQLSRFQFLWPGFTAASVAAMMRWLMVILIVAGLLWAVDQALRQRAARTR